MISGLPLFARGRCPISDRFHDFHRRNPHVYVTLAELAHRWNDRHPGRRCGIAMLFEVARWTISLTTDEEFKLDNSYRAHYARLISTCEPGLENLFETRTLRSA
jgi:hypothetical protein